MLTRVVENSRGDCARSATLPTVPTAQEVIRVEHVTKRYRIYPTQKDRFRDALGWRCDYKEFAALDDVTFDIRQGEFWGIVGRNGSGKSTLLKIVAGLLQPTSGEVSCQGKLALLQLGLGFDPEQTGLENIRHSRLLQNLRSDYDDIVQFVQDFSELGDFIRFPVKTYSSGMHSRLAFATAIAGAPDILIADEVLAVGDMNFSQKCLAKMREFKEQGKTVVLVTHDINSVKTFCDHGVWLNDGKVVSIGPAKMIAEDFRNFMIYGVISDLSADEEASEGAQSGKAAKPAGPGPESQESTWIAPKSSRRTVSNGRVEIQRYRFLDWTTRAPARVLVPGQVVALEIQFRVMNPTDIHSFAFTLHDRNGLIAAHLNSAFFGMGNVERQPGEEWTARFRFDVPMLASGDYSISFGCSEGADGILMEKYDHDSVVTIEHPSSVVTENQGGYVVIPTGAFEYTGHD